MAENFEKANVRPCVNISPDVYTNMVKQVLIKTFKPKTVGKFAHKPVYWWSSDIAELRRACLGRRRALTRSNKIKEERENLKRIYKEAKAALTKAIQNAKRQAWNNLCDEVEENVWGDGFKIVTKKFGKIQPNLLTNEEEYKQATKLFPQHKNETWKRIPVKDTDFTPFTDLELVEALNTIKCEKAEGPAGISPEVVKFLIGKYSLPCLKAMKETLSSGTFSEIWKMARLVLLEKEHKAKPTDEDIPPHMYSKRTRKSFRTPDTSEIEHRDR